MKYNIEDLKKSIKEFAKDLDQIVIMEVCGTHTASIQRYGIRQLLPDSIKLVSGPGCPVCVTAQADISVALSIAKQDDVIFTCFGDMMRVPCEDESLYSLYERGYDIRIVTSPMDALNIAKQNESKQIVYFGIGFETTAPLTAALIETAFLDEVSNLSVLSAHKTMPEAVVGLLGKTNNIDALICPGHVATILGSDAFSFVPDKLLMPGAIAGFGALDIMISILSIVKMIKTGEKKCVNMYPRAVRKEGNKCALKLLYNVFEPCDALWRGLGEIKDSGLKIKDGYKKFDALNRFEIHKNNTKEAKGCICTDILCGKNIPTDCINFAGKCTPQTPLGACMVSSEGSCSAYYHY